VTLSLEGTHRDRCRIVFSNCSVMTEIATYLRKYVTYLMARLGMTKNLHRKGLWEVCGPPSCSEQGQLWGQTRLFRALSSRVLKTSKDGDCTASLATCSITCLCSRGKVIPYIQSKPLFFQVTRIVSLPATFEPHHSTSFLVHLFFIVHPFSLCHPHLDKKMLCKTVLKVLRKSREMTAAVPSSTFYHFIISVTVRLVRHDLALVNPG